MDEQKIKEAHIFTRAYFYLQKGADVVNYFRYVIVGIMALYYLLQFNNIRQMIIMFVVSGPVLMILGYFYIHKMAQALEWLTIQYGTYWVRYGFTLQEKILKELEKLNKRSEK